MYKFEIHLHTCACSACATSSAFEMIDAAAANKYSGIVFTNHFFHGNTAIDRKLPWKEFVKAYTDDYLKAKDYGKLLGITVLFGIEDGYMPGKEMLIYGVKPEIIAAHPAYKDMSPREMSDFVHENGGIAICAHPFRERAYIPDPDTEPDIALFDGIECHNHFNRPEENEKATVFAKKHGMLCTAGGDIHNAKDFGNTGLAFFEPVNTIEEFVAEIKENRYKLIINGETE